MSLCRGVPLNLIVLLSFILFVFFHHRAATILPEVDDPHELAAYLRSNFAAKNKLPEHVQELSGLLCPEQKPSICPESEELGCPIPAVEDPLITGPKSLEQKSILDLREQGIAVILKTGAQEVSQLGIHLGTMLRFFQEQDILFFSDLQETIGPFVIHDALKKVDQKIRETHVDFKMYRDIRRYQTAGRDVTELKEDKKKGQGRWGWRLDKYKFIHMVEESYLKKPSAKWYVFIETDSYVFWPNLVTWLKKLDPTKPLYLGAGLIHEKTYFAHGGSGFILSNPAMNMLLGQRQTNELAASWDTKMDGECCGDVALAKALYEQGVNLTGSHPFLNGYKPSTFTYGPNQHWCQPAVTMHHLMPHEISSVWRFERQREVLRGSNATTFSELYSHFIEPHIVPSRDNWDNLSDGPTYTEPDEVSKARKQEREKTFARSSNSEKRYADGRRNPMNRKSEDVLRAAALSSKATFFEENEKEKTSKHKRSQLSDIEKDAYKSFESCGRACEDQNGCFQWVFYDRTCRLSTSIRWGNYQAPTNGKDKGEDGKPEQVGWKSGWLVERISKWVKMNECKEPDWKI